MNLRQMVKKFLIWAVCHEVSPHGIVIFLFKKLNLKNE